MRKQEPRVLGDFGTDVREEYRKECEILVSPASELDYLREDATRLFQDCGGGRRIIRKKLGGD